VYLLAFLAEVIRQTSVADDRSEMVVAVGRMELPVDLEQLTLFRRIMAISGLRRNARSIYIRDSTAARFK